MNRFLCCLIVASAWFGLAGVGSCAAAEQSAPGPNDPVVDEGFDTFANLSAAGWFQQNNSMPADSGSWGQGDPTTGFNAYDGDPSAYAAVSTGAAYGSPGAVSDWLVTPLINFGAGSQLSFYAQTLNFIVNNHPDRLQVLLCVGDPCTDVGSTPSEVGQFTQVLLDLNADYGLDGSGLPNIWTRYTVGSDQLPTSGTGRIAFRYLIEDTETEGYGVGLDRVVLDNGDGGPVFPPDENFDEVTPPDLPLRWTSMANGGDVPWVTQDGDSDTGSNSAYVPGADSAGDSALVSPMVVVGYGATLTFRQHFAFDPGFDGGRLEISVDGADFQEVTAIGGMFTEGGYNGTLATSASCGAQANPLGDGPAWTGDQADYATTSLSLPASLHGRAVQFRWRAGSDCSGSAAEPNGWWIDTIHIDVGQPNGFAPVAAVAPESLAFNVSFDGTAQQALTISNTVEESVPLTYAVRAQGSTAEAASSSPMRIFADRALLDHVAAAGKLPLATPRGRFDGRAVQSGSHEAAPWSPVGPDGSLTFQNDNGSYSTSLAFRDGSSQHPSIWVNRFSPPTGVAPYLIDTISIDWPDPDTATGDLVGKLIDLVVYYDASASGNLGNAVRLGIDTFITIGETSIFENYPVQFSVPGDGDIYIGFVDSFADGGTLPIILDAALDESAANTAYVSATVSANPDIDHPANNASTGRLSDFTGGEFVGSFMVRATATIGGTGGPCSGPQVSWLSAEPASGSVPGGSTNQIMITVNPAAAQLGAGNYNAALCIATNDPTQAEIAVPVQLTVTSSGADDAIFIDGFDG